MIQKLEDGGMFRNHPRTPTSLQISSLFPQVAIRLPWFRLDLGAQVVASRMVKKRPWAFPHPSNAQARATSPAFFLGLKQAESMGSFFMVLTVLV